jgi:hypothetical protein
MPSNLIIFPIRFRRDGVADDHFQQSICINQLSPGTDRRGWLSRSHALRQWTGRCTGMTRDGDALADQGRHIVCELFGFSPNALAISSFSDVGADGSVAPAVLWTMWPNFGAARDSNRRSISGRCLAREFRDPDQLGVNLEASEDLRQWAAVTVGVAGTGQDLTLTDEGPARLTGKPGRGSNRNMRYRSISACRTPMNGDVL